MGFDFVSVCVHLVCARLRAHVYVYECVCMYGCVCICNLWGIWVSELKRINVRAIAPLNFRQKSRKIRKILLVLQIAAF